MPSASTSILVAEAGVAVNASRQYDDDLRSRSTAEPSYVERGQHRTLSPASTNLYECTPEHLQAACKAPDEHKIPSSDRGSPEGVLPGIRRFADPSQAEGLQSISSTPAISRYTSATPQRTTVDSQDRDHATESDEFDAKAAAPAKQDTTIPRNTESETPMTDALYLSSVNLIVTIHGDTTESTESTDDCGTIGGLLRELGDCKRILRETSLIESIRSMVGHGISTHIVKQNDVVQYPSLLKLVRQAVELSNDGTPQVVDVKANVVLRT